MTLYFAGAGLDSFFGTNLTERNLTSSYPNIITEIDCVGNANGDYTTPHVAVANLTSASGNSVALSSYWCQVYANVNSSSSNAALSYPFGISFVAADKSNINFTKTYGIDSGMDINLISNTGVVTQIKTGLFWNTGSYTNYDFQFTGIGTKTGTISIYVNQVLYYSWSGDLSSIGFTTSVTIASTNHFETVNLLSCIVQDKSTLGAYIIKQIGTTAGSLTEWTGQFSNLTKVPYDSTSYILASSAGLSETAIGTVPTYDNTMFYISGVTLTSLVLNTSTSMGVSNIITYNGTTYTLPPVKNTGLYPNMSILDKAPDGNAWNASNIKSLEFGIKTVSY